ncbi:MAG TPA: SurA N-terminal domain-containing protein [Candidatus Saccharimonadales bacterium]|nr:SurA N-terminal domain-containing protein [Candidatus Saccharimonadales bacterium]
MNNIIPSKFNKKEPELPETGGRITNETVAQHRERILAGGRKFKYPLQYTKHRVLIISILIFVVAFIGLFSFATWQLYGAQNVSAFMYRLTTVVPFPVAKVEGQWVAYSDYLRELRSSIHYFSTKEAVNFNSDDGKRQLEYQKRLALNKSTETAFIKKLAKENDVSVSRQEVNDFVAMQISSNKLGLTEDAYRQIIRNYYDWSLDEYKQSIHNQLLQTKVAAKIGTEERAKIDGFLAQLNAGVPFEEVAKSSEDVIAGAKGGDIGTYGLADNDPNGLIAAANQLEVGATSGVINGTNGFYIIKLVARPSEKEVTLSAIFVGYKALQQKLEEFRQSGVIDEFIKVEPIASPTT